MTLKNVIERFCSRNVKEREQNENAGTLDNVECFHCSRCSREIKLSPQINSAKNAVLQALIRQVSKNYGGDDLAFMEEYISDVICAWHHDLGKIITCFQDLAIQRFPVNNRK
jgi:hypothetical protein